MKVESLRSIFPPERKKRKKTFRVTFRVSISIKASSCLREKIQNTLQKKKTNEGADEKNEEY